MKRPTSEYSRIAKGLGDLNPRYKFDNILQLDLDMPERTTEDYEGIPSAKVQQAIQAILNDNDIKQENIPITTLINFNDSCLIEDVPVDASAVPSNRPRSSKRPGTSKKKKQNANAIQEIIWILGDKYPLQYAPDKKQEKGKINYFNTEKKFIHSCFNTFIFNNFLS